MRVLLETADGVRIVGTSHDVAQAKGHVLLLHMMPATKESWVPLQESLAAAGIASLAIDLRGHGESVSRAEGGMLDYRVFGDREHQASRLDVRAALAWFEEQGADRAHIVLGGASIGANLVLEAIAEDPEIPAAFLLSGGHAYRGIEAEPLAEVLRPEQALLLIAAADDANMSLDAHRAIARVTQARVAVREFETGGHGTQLFATQPSVLTEITQWVRGIIT